MTKRGKKLDTGIRLNPTTTTGVEDGEIWVDSDDNKVKVVLDNVVQCVSTTNSNTAEGVPYDNSISLLNATNVQDAIGQLKLLMDFLNMPSVKSLSIIQQPTNQNQNTNIIPPVTVRLKDQYGDPITGTNSITATLNGSGTLSGTLVVNAVGGIATFSNLKVDNIGSYTITFSSTGLLSDTSDSFTISPAPIATSLIIIQQPTNENPNVPIVPSVTVQIKDQYGNNISSTNSITATISAGGNLYGTTVVNAVGGLATFSDLKVSTSGTYTLDFNSSGLTGDTSDSFTISLPAPIATSLSIQTQPSSTLEDTVITPSIRIRVKDQYNFDMAGTNSVITATLSDGGTLLGTTVVSTLASSQAVFDDLQVDTAGYYTMEFTSPGLTSVTSVTFNIAEVPVPTTLSFRHTNQDQLPNCTLKRYPELELLDQFNNTIVYVGSPVTATLSVGGVLSGTLTENFVGAGGRATFDNLQIDNIGTYTITYDSPLVPSITSSSFEIANIVDRDLVWDPWGDINIDYSTTNQYNDTLEWTSNGTYSALTMLGNYSQIEKEDGYFEFKHKVTGVDDMCFGLSNLPIIGGYSQFKNSIEYGIEMRNGSNTLYNLRNGATSVIGTISVDDIIRVEVRGDNVYIKQNGSIIHTWSSQTISYPLYAVVAVSDKSYKIAEIKFVNSLAPTHDDWIFSPSTNPYDFTSTANSLIRTDEEENNDSYNFFYGDTLSGDSFMQFNIAASDKQMELGFSDDPILDPQNNGAGVTYGMFFSAGQGEILMLINNAAGDQFGLYGSYLNAYAAGDLIRVERIGTQIRVYVNGSILHTFSGITLNSPYNISVSPLQVTQGITNLTYGPL